MDEDDFSINTSCIVADYISYRLGKDGFSWTVSPTRNCPNNKVTSTVRKLCEEFEKRYEKQFAEMCSACGGDVKINAEDYMAVLDQLIVDGLHWGRVIGIFTFAGAMSVYCMKQGKKDRIDWIREWTCSFINSKVDWWIQQNDGWKGLVDFHTNGLPKREEERRNGWGNFLIGGAIGAFALGALIINKA